jgi:hypothetical protein
LKDLEKSLVGNQDAYTSLKSKLENLPEKVIVMGSHTQIDNRKEKVILWQIFWYLYLYICYLILLSLSISWQYIFTFSMTCYVTVPCWWSSIYEVWRQPHCITWSCFSGMQSIAIMVMSYFFFNSVFVFSKALWLMADLPLVFLSLFHRACVHIEIRVYWINMLLS